MCPTLGGSAPAIIDDRHVDAAVDEELHGFVIFVNHTSSCRMLAGSWELQFVLISAPCPRRKSAISKWLLRTAQASAVSRTCCTLGSPHCRFPRIVGTVGGKMIREVAQGRLARRVEPASHACEVPVPGCVRQIVGHGPDAQQHRKQMGLRIREREFNGLRWRRHATVQHSGIEIKKSRNESCAIVRSTARSINPTWNFTHASDSIHASRRNPPTKDVRSPSFTARTTCCMTKACQGPAGSALVNVELVRDEVLDKCGTSRPAIDPPSQLGVERDGPIQQQRRCGRVLEMAGTHERFVHRGKIVAIRIKTCANAIDVAERGKELERSGKKASAVEEIEQPPCAGSDEAIAYRRRDDCAGIDQELGTCRAREVLLPERVEAVAEGTGSHPEQPAVVFIRPPRQ